MKKVILVIVLAMTVLSMVKSQSQQIVQCDVQLPFPNSGSASCNQNAGVLNFLPAWANQKQGIVLIDYTKDDR